MKRMKKLLALALALSLAPTALAESGHTHSWKERSRTEPTCTQAGSVTYVCSCGEKKVEPLPALGHAWNAGEIVEDESFPGGKKLHFWCWRCGETRDEALPAEEPDDYGWEPPEELEEPGNPEGEVSPASGEPEDGPKLLLQEYMKGLFTLGNQPGEKHTFCMELRNEGTAPLLAPRIDLYLWDKNIGDFVFHETVLSDEDYVLETQRWGKHSFILTEGDLENAMDGHAQYLFIAYAKTKEGEEVESEPLLYSFPIYDATVLLKVENPTEPQNPEAGYVKAKVRVKNVGTETLCYDDIWCRGTNADKTEGFFTNDELRNYDLSWFQQGTTEEAEIWIEVCQEDLDAGEVRRELNIIFGRWVREGGRTVFFDTPKADVQGIENTWYKFWSNEVEVVIPLAEEQEDTPPALAPAMVSACQPALTGLGDGATEWTLTRCPDHAAVAREAEGKTGAEALALWSEALDAEYEEWLAEADESLRPLIEAERDAFMEQLEAYRALWTDQVGADFAAEKAAELAKHKLSLLCFARHADEEAWAALLGEAESGQQGTASCSLWSQDLGTELRVREQTCENHRGLGLQASDAQSARALKLSWLQALNEETDEWYLSADEESRPLIAEARQSFGRWLAAEEALLNLQYPENEALVQQLLALAVRERAMDSCGVGGAFSVAEYPEIGHMSAGDS